MTYALRGMVSYFHCLAFSYGQARTIPIRCVAAYFFENGRQKCPFSKNIRIRVGRGGGVLLGILGGGVPPGSPNPDPISDQKMSFSTPVFRPDL